jgi:PRTRC genetic system protein A
MMKPVGYLVKYPDHLEGERGMFYDYVLASNGLYVEAEGPLFAARVPVAPAEVRGLAPLETKLALRYGRIPQYIFDLAVNYFLTDMTHERYVAVTYQKGDAICKGEYGLHTPRQAETEEQVAAGEDQRRGSGGGLAFENMDNVILDIHSHHKMQAWFSPRDNTDEAGLRLYAVVGRLDASREVRLRVGVYGYRATISWGDVFDGTLQGVDDIGDFPFDPGDEELAKLEAEEVTEEDDVQSPSG